jgi:hypothetical protein
MISVEAFSRRHGWRMIEMINEVMPMHVITTLDGVDILGIRLAAYSNYMTITAPAPSRYIVSYLTDGSSERSIILIDTAQPDGEVAFTLDNGEVESVPLRETVDREIMFAVARHFFLTGERLQPLSSAILWGEPTSQT